MLSIWETSSFHRPPHVAIVGGGIVGLFTALYYKRAHPQHHVLVLERGAFPSGASVKNAGFACFGSPSELLSDIALEGEEAALQRVELRWRGLHELRAELGDEAIGLETVGGHEIFLSDDPLYTQVAERFDELNDLLKPILGSRTYHWNESSIAAQGLGRVAHMARTDLEATLNSGMLLQTLLKKAVAEGVLYRSNFEVVAIEEHGGHVELRSTTHETLRAAQVVLATNGYTRRLFSDLDVVPARGQILLTNEIPGLRLKGAFHYGAGFYYFRDLNGRVLLGGGRDLDLAGETTDKEGTTPLIQNKLEEILKEIILPGTPYKIEDRWSGIMAFGDKSKTPLIERLSDRITIAARLGGMGVAIGTQVARKAAEMIE